MKSLIIMAFILLMFGCSEPVPIGENIMEIDVGKEPVQDNKIDVKAMVVQKKNYIFTITPKAAYKISGVVKSVKRYSDDWNSYLSPLDVALVWGRLAEPDMDKYIRYWQEHRWYYYRYEAGTPVSKDYIIKHSSNNHLIPANENIKQALNLIEKGQMIYIDGYLVNVDGGYKNDKYWWRTSLTRDDTGDGSCEVIYVKRINIGGKIYQ
jgi:hypothetical protein